MSGSRAGLGRWLALAVLVLLLFGSCRLLAGRVSAEWGPAFLIWVVLLIPLKLINDRYRKMKWPMEFITWAVILLFTVNMLWLRFAVPE